MDHETALKAANAEPRSHEGQDGPIRNAMTVDVEDYFQVSAFSGQVERDDWQGLPCRVEGNSERVLQLFADAGVSATFFVLGWVAERYPALIRRIVEQGHELASHGYAHYRIHEQAPAAFREDVRRTKGLLEDIGGCAVRGYRAASFSLNEKTLWAAEVLAGEGYRYSSSVYPIRHDLYGMPAAPRFAFEHRGAGGLLEIPISTLRVMGQNLPCGGGGYFRLLPYAWSRWAMRRVNRKERRSCVFYFHPWEIDAEQPRMAGSSLKTRVRHYTNLDRMESRLRSVLRDFAWDRLDRLHLPESARA